MLRMIRSPIAEATTPHVTPHVAHLLAILEGEMPAAELLRSLGLRDRKSFRERYLSPALASGLIEMTLPDRPNSRLQKYRLTEAGRSWLAPKSE